MILIAVKQEIMNLLISLAWWKKIVKNTFMFYVIR